MGTMGFAGYLLGAFVLSVVAGYWLTYRKRSRLAHPPEVGITLRIRAASGMYRSRLLAVTPSGWKIGAPLSRNRYVPLRVGEVLTIEAPVDDGVYLFKTVVTARDAASHELTLKAPPELKPTNRREVVRCARDESVRIEGTEGHLVDISALGARLQSNRHFPAGEGIRLDLLEGMVYGWVLDSWPTRMGEAFRENLRVRFEVTVENACA